MSDKQHQNQPDLTLKWGKSPSSQTSKPPDESSFTPEQQAEREKLRKQGVNPDLKAEMDAKVYGKGEPVDGENRGKLGGLMNKLAGTASGGGWIK